ncbi:SRPBCC family protein [Piscinibacter sakaiensis]|uniref:SRPBCC family protein n=1 Tax=Piscinibacter sakaiensis TaxID=1547922 RepID=UPI003AAE1F84
MTDNSNDRLSKPFTITRQFGAPRELVFDALTKRDHLQRWMSPAGLEPVAGRLDLREGGSYHYGMRLPGGATMWGKWTFREIAPPERLVTVVQFSDEAGGLTRHPMAPLWPMHTLSTTTLTEAGTGQTTMTLQWQALNATEAEMQVFDASHLSMEMGWKGTMDQLAAHLDEVQRGGTKG